MFIYMFILFIIITFLCIIIFFVRFSKFNYISIFLFSMF